MRWAAHTCLGPNSGLCCPLHPWAADTSNAPTWQPHHPATQHSTAQHPPTNLSAAPQHSTQHKCPTPSTRQYPATTQHRKHSTHQPTATYPRARAWCRASCAPPSAAPWTRLLPSCSRPSSRAAPSRAGSVSSGARLCTKQGQHARVRSGVRPATVTPGRGQALAVHCAAPTCICLTASCTSFSCCFLAASLSACHARQVGPGTCKTGVGRSPSGGSGRERRATQGLHPRQPG